MLKTELREFQAENFAGPIPKAHVTIIARLVQIPRRAIVGSKKFEAIVPAESDSMEAIINAFDVALGKVLKRLVEWTLPTGEAAQKRS